MGFKEELNKVFNDGFKEDLKKLSKTVLEAQSQKESEYVSDEEAIEAAKRKLTGQYKIDEGRIIMEEKSRDTVENLKYSLEIIKDSKTTVGIVTNGFHEYRAMAIAHQLGYQNVYPIPARTLMPVGIHYTVREFFGMVEFWVMKYF